MGALFLIVNPTKREYLDPFRFGEGAKIFNVLCGPHCLLALKYLIRDDGPGRWVGDSVVLASDDGASANPNSLTTSSASNPARNLHEQAREEFANISHVVLARLSYSTKVAEQLAERAREDQSLILELGAVLDQYGSPPLEFALESAVGRPWRKAFNIARTASHRWQPLPLVEWSASAGQVAADRSTV